MHPFKYLIGIISIFVILLTPACRQDSIRPKEIRLKTGNKSEWLGPKTDDSAWEMANGTDAKGNFIVRFHFKLSNDLRKSFPLAVNIVALGSYDAFWDNNKIGSSGKIGNNIKEEIPGYHSMVLPIPDSLAKAGNHVLALRISNFHYQRKYSFFNARIESYRQLMRFPMLMALLMAVLAGCFLTGSIYYLFLFVQHKNEKPYLFFAFICLLFLSLLVCEYLPILWAYPYTFQLTRLEIIGMLATVIAFLIPSFLNRMFATFSNWPFDLVLSITLISVFILNHGHYDLSAQLMGLVMATGSLAVSSFAIKKKKKGAWLILIAIILGLAVSWFLYYDYSLYIAFGLLLLAMLYLLSERSKAMETAYRRSLVISERLKTDLLKKSIQPHFIMNTLTALLELIESSPDLGKKMILDLSSEFEILCSIAEKSLIPLATEISLCKHHMEIMQMRKGIDYRWESIGIDNGEYLPPAIIHTLLENGITHSKPLEDGTVRFRLEYEQTPKEKIYRFQTQAVNRTKRKLSYNGMGFYYIEARLREAYAEKWELNYGPGENGWTTTIKLHK